MTEKTPIFNRALFEALAEGAIKSHENAKSLCEEAALLREKGKLARAFFLHQISLEECAKIDLIGPWIIALFAGHSFDEKKLRGSLENHAVKNKTNAYMLRASPDELAARSEGDWKRAISIFHTRAKQFHEESNDAKNGSLYVDFNNGSFFAPHELITEAKVGEIASRNEEFLDRVTAEVRMLRAWAKSPEAYQPLIADFMKQLGDMESGDADALEAIQKTIARYLEVHAPTIN
jgi:AbiV family abortive infection protein